LDVKNPAYCFAGCALRFKMAPDPKPIKPGDINGTTPRASLLLSSFILYRFLVHHMEKRKKENGVWKAGKCTFGSMMTWMRVLLLLPFWTRV